MRASRSRNAAVRKGVTYLSVLFYVLLVILPLYWLVLTSLRTQHILFNQPDILVPRNLTFQNYIDLFTKRPMMNWLGNSLFVSLIATLLSMVIAVPSAYAIVRLKFRGAAAMAKAVLFMYLLPQALLFIPLYIMANKVGLVNKLPGLMLVYPTFVLPFCTWLLIGYFRTIPVELEDAARIDGCNRLGVLLRVVLPLVAPAIVTAAIFGLTQAWNEYLYAVVFINSERHRTVQIGVASLRIGDTIIWPLIMAGAVICMIPPVFLYMFMQRYVVEGLTAGAVKG